MKVLKISNEGLLDVNELILMGCSSKTGENTIGKFGTGLKYAISVLTRNEIDFSIFIGTKEIKIQKEPINIRGKEFEQVVINYEKTSITTNLGVEWTVSQGVREFIANAIDMNGEFVVVDDNSLSLSPSQTTIVFNNFSQIEDCMGDYDFSGWEEVEEGFFFKKLDSPRRAKVFKEGFLVYEAEENSSFDYRIDNLNINEARMAEDRWEVKRGIAKIMSLMEEGDVKTLIENKEIDNGIFYSSDTLSNGWSGIEKKDIEGKGYCLSEVIKKKVAEDKNEEEVNLYEQGYTYVNKDISEMSGEYLVYFQLTENSTLVDFNPKTNEIYVWGGNLDVQGSDLNEAFDNIMEKVICNKIVLENDLDDALEAILYIKRTQGLKEQ